MDEVDNIIIHSLRQIGCNVDEDVSSLTDLTPENLVEFVSKCLRSIEPSLDVPERLPPGIAQRYNVTTALSEACASIGFRGDIGYQTFLYSNVTEVRRVFMFLTERLPKESDKLTYAELDRDRKSMLEHNIVHNINIQLNAAWTPQFCKKFGVRSFGNAIAIQASNNGFLPNRLNLPYATNQQVSNELSEYWLKRSPTVFQQTCSSNICSSLIHKNDIDCEGSSSATINGATAAHSSHNFRKLIRLQQFSGASPNSSAQIKKEHMRNIKSVQQLALNNIEIPNENDIVEMPEIRESDAIRFDIENLKAGIEQWMQNQKQLQANIAECKAEKQKKIDQLPKLKNDKKIKERTQLLLKNPEENLAKMEQVLVTAQERISKLKDQWDEHRIPLEQQLEKAKRSSVTKYSHTKQLMDQIKLMREKADELTEDLKVKATQHAQLVDEFERSNRNISRNAYTSRILEIIGNIKKQKTSIDNILIDTRGIQKEINTINGQLDRQFTVTDDLLFKCAKKDEPSKKAYKLLATLHSNCGDLVQMVQETGNVQRDVRDLEDQIENERDRNISGNLIQITNDLKLLEYEAKEIQKKINSYNEK